MEHNQSIKPWKPTVFGFLSAQTISLLGSSLVQYAIVWHITLSTSSGRMLTLSTLCGFVPQLLVALFGGVLVDRYDRKKIIMLADGIIAAATLVLALLFLSGHQNIWLLLAVLAIRSAGTGVQTPAVQSLLPQITPAPQLMRVNGIYSTLNSIMMLLSPAASGAVLALFGLEATLLVDVVTAVIGISITAGLHIPKLVSTAQAASPLAQLKQGFAYLKADRALAQLLLFQLAVLFFISPSAFLTPLMVSRTFGPEVWRLTASEMTYSVGMVLGGALITAWGGFKNRRFTTALAGLVYGLCMLGLGAAPVFLLYLILNTLIGITAPCYNTPITVWVQEQVEPALHGRVFSFMQIATSCALPLGMTVFGPLADLVPVQWLLFLGGGMVILCTGLALLGLRGKQSR